MFNLVMITAGDSGQEALAELHADDIKAVGKQQEYGWIISVDPKSLEEIRIDGLPKSAREEYTNFVRQPFVVRLYGRTVHAFLVDSFYWRRA